MDRDVVYGLVFSTIALTLIGGWYLTPGKARVADTAVAEVAAEGIVPGTPRQYSPEDVRFKFEQRAKKGNKRGAANPVADDAPAPEPSENEEPPVDEGGDESAEEPPID